MVAYNFQKQFVDSIEKGLKKSTIRGIGKRSHARVGDALQLYTGMRTKSCKLIKNAVCTQVNKITIWGHIREVWITVPDPRGDLVRTLKKAEIEQLAINDGFKNSEEFFQFFGLVDANNFDGYMISWGE